MVTGASSGIGDAIARQLAAEGTDLVLVARDEARLARLADELTERRVAVDVLAADLTAADDLRRVEARLATGDVDLLVNNAGAGSGAPFLQANADREAQLVALNATAVLRCTRAVLPSMVAAGRGAVCNVSSLAGHQPAPTSPTYAATKAFVTSLSESLHEQMRGTGVTVTAVCPGFTRTEFLARSGGDEGRAAPSWAWMSAEAVAGEALDATAAGRAVWVPGRGYRIVAGLSDLLPRGVRRRAVGWTSRTRGIG